MSRWGAFARSGRVAVSGVLALAMLAALTACLGSVTRQDLDQEMRSRGSGGIGERLLLGAVEAVADDLGTRDVELRSLTASLARVTLEVRVPGTDDLDSYTYGTSGLYGGRGLSGPSPVSVSADGPSLEAQVFESGGAGLDRFNDLVDHALAEAALPGGYVDGATVRLVEPGGGPVIAIAVTNKRSSVTVSFRPDGSMIGTEHS